MHYQQSQVRKIPVLPERFLEIFNELNQKLSLKEITEDRVTLPKLMIDFVHGSAVDEGSTYTICSLETLLETGKPSRKNDFEEAAMIVNIKDALDYAVSIKEVDLTKRDISDIHFFLSKGLVGRADGGTVRNRPVYITGSSYEPCAGQAYITSELEEILKISKSIIEPFTKAIYLNINLAYLQPFIDFNKRTARVVQVHSMLHDGVVPLFINAESVYGFKKAVKLYYETGEITEYLGWFMSAYLAMYSKLIGRNEVESYREDLRTFKETYKNSKSDNLGNSDIFTKE